MSRKTVGPPVGCYSVTTLSFSIMESSSGGADGSKGSCGGWLDTPFSGWGATSEPALSNVSSEELAGSPARRPGSDDRLRAISGGSEGAPSRTRRQVLRAHTVPGSPHRVLERAQGRRRPASGGSAGGG